MILQDLISIIWWWVLLLGIGLLVFPITFLFFRKFWDHGWGFSKILGLSLLSYWVWIVGSLKILAFSSFTMWVGIFLIGFISYLVWKRREKLLRKAFNNRWRLFAFEEGLFATGLLFWSWVRAHQPDINGLEKFMDFGFINSILSSRFFPPPDMWLAGETINYYYFGHLVTAVITKLSGISSSITYNLMLATILGLALTGAFSLGATLVRSLIPQLAPRLRNTLSILAGLVSALVLTFAGNLHTIITILTKGTDSYWYPDATRYIPYTIHEFPHYSFVVADLHGHVNNIGFVLLAVAFVVSFLLELGTRKRLTFLPRPFLLKFLSMGFVIGILYMTNAMDAPIYLFLTATVLFATAFGKHSLGKVAVYTGIALSVIVISALFFSLPFHLAFTPFTKGVEFVQARSSVWQLFVLWGFFLFVGWVFVFTISLKRFLPSLRRVHFNPFISRFILAVFFVSVVLVIIPEVIYFKDIYITEYHRANTMFKLVYQTFILMALITGPVFVFLISVFFQAQARIRLVLGTLFFLFIFGLGSVLIYPYFSVRAYYHHLQNNQGLDGLLWLERRYPDDYAAVLWLQKEVVGQPGIAEAVGESYTDFARVSSNTGLPTILGWRVHEWLWRGSFDEPSFRTGEVARLYTTADVRDACDILNRYNIQYIFVGALERKQYKPLNEGTFQALGDLSFSQGNTRIYRVRTPCGSPLDHTPLR